MATVVDHRGSPQVPTIVFEDEGAVVSGSSGCNRFTGSYTLAGDSLRIGQVASTSMVCVGGQDLEQEFLKSFESLDEIHLAGRLLEWWANGHFIARFEGEAQEE